MHEEKSRHASVNEALKRMNVIERREIQGVPELTVWRQKFKFEYLPFWSIFLLQIFRDDQPNIGEIVHQFFMQIRPSWNSGLFGSLCS